MRKRGNEGRKEGRKGGKERKEGRGYLFGRNANYKVGFFTFIIPLETNKQVIFAFIFVFVYRTVSYILPRLLRPRY